MSGTKGSDNSGSLFDMVSDSETPVQKWDQSEVPQVREVRD